MTEKQNKEIKSARSTKEETLAAIRVGPETATQRRNKIAPYWFKGFTKEEIAKKTGYSLAEVSAAIERIKLQLEPKTIRSIEYYRNKARRNINLGLSQAWDIIETYKTQPHTILRSLSIIERYIKLMTEVDGIVTDKMPAGPDKKAEALLNEVKKLAKEAATGKGKGDTGGEVSSTSEEVSDKKDEEWDIQDVIANR